ncbi:hypothetical protein AVEN_223812-1 [Araneus ventricosus]|uniref:Uncharacterized protein n=1 Tax=Araneus ventricosus TaxID=182803 RepID=A0A4Y2DKL4_ARAVE|nr:hypothetical protein AVEN_223812-1 [Araneus ventricosus]
MKLFKKAKATRFNPGWQQSNQASLYLHLCCLGGYRDESLFWVIPMTPADSVGSVKLRRRSLRNKSRDTTIPLFGTYRTAICFFFQGVVINIICRHHLFFGSSVSNRLSPFSLLPSPLPSHFVGSSRRGRPRSEVVTNLLPGWAQPAA